MERKESVKTPLRDSSEEEKSLSLRKRGLSTTSSVKYVADLLEATPFQRESLHNGERDLSTVLPRRYRATDLRNITTSKNANLINGLDIDDNKKADIVGIIIQNQAQDMRAEKERNSRLLIAIIGSFALIIVAIIAVPNIFTHFFPNSSERHYEFRLPEISKEIIKSEEGHWYSEAVEYLSSYEIDLGYNKDENIVRHELAEWIVKVFIQPEDKQYLRIAKDLKIISYKSTNDYISRNEAAEIILKFFTQLDIHIPEVSNLKTIYSNEDKKIIKKINKGAKKELIELAEKGIIWGSPDKSLMPESSLTRLELAQILYRLIERLNEHSVV